MKTEKNEESKLSVNLNSDSNNFGGYQIGNELNLSEDDFLELKKEGIENLITEIDSNNSKIQGYWPPQGEIDYEEIKNMGNNKVLELKKELEIVQDKLGDTVRKEDLIEGEIANEELRELGIDLYGENETENHEEIKTHNILSLIEKLNASIDNI